MPFSVHDNVDHPLSLYAASKKSNELMAHTYSHLYDLPTTGLRFFTVYGPWGRPDMALFKFTKAILAGEPIQVFNHGRHQRDFTYIDDIVEGVVRVLDQPAQAKPPEPPAPSISGIDIDKILQQAQPFLEQIQERDIPFEEPSVQPEEPVSLPEEKMEGVTSVQVLGLAIPMPEPEILVAAGATATVSVGATLASTAVYKRAVTAFKPVIKKLITAYQKSQGKETTSWARERLAQRLHKLPSTDYRDGT